MTEHIDLIEGKKRRFAAVNWKRKKIYESPLLPLLCPPKY